MEIILVNRSGGQARPISLGANTIKWMSGLLIGIMVTLLVLGVWSGMKLSPWIGEVQASVEAERTVANLVLSDWQALVDEQQAQIGDLKRDAAEETRALSRRLALMQAQVTRLEAAGMRLAEISGLEAGEFDFSSQPALGGPELEADDSAESTRDLQAAFAQTEAQINDRARQLRVLEDLLIVARQHNESRPQGLPVESGWISSLFGHRRDPITGRRTRHEGIDFAAKPGTHVMSVGSGIVVTSGHLGAYGNTVEVNHGNGYVTRYAHNQRNVVKVGDRVNKGEVIAKVGSTGRSTGPHLHFEVFYNGNVVDPQRYIQAAR